MSDGQNPAFDPNAVHIESVRDVPQTLAEFLLARIAEDEADARRVAADLEAFPPSAYDAAQVPMCDAGEPERVLAECAAYRAIIDVHRPIDNDPEPFCWNCDTDEWPCPTLRALAGIWSDHDDYREEWA